LGLFDDLLTYSKSEEAANSDRKPFWSARPTPPLQQNMSLNFVDIHVPNFMRCAGRLAVQKHAHWADLR